MPFSGRKGVRSEAERGQTESVVVGSRRCTARTGSHRKGILQNLMGQSYFRRSFLRSLCLSAKQGCLEGNRHVLMMSTPQSFAAATDDEVALVVDCSTLMRLLLPVPPVRDGFSGTSHALFASGRCRLDK